MASVGVTGHVVAAAYLALLTGWLIGRLGGSIRLGGARRFVVDAAAAAEGLVDEEKADEVDVLEEPG